MDQRVAALQRAERIFAHAELEIALGFFNRPSQL